MRGGRREQHVRRVQCILYRGRSLRPSASLDDGCVFMWLSAQGVSLRIHLLTL
jgi:hypothetical protein